MVYLVTFFTQLSADSKGGTTKRDGKRDKCSRQKAPITPEAAWLGVDHRTGAFGPALSIAVRELGPDIERVPHDTWLAAKMARLRYSLAR